MSMFESDPYHRSIKAHDGPILSVKLVGSDLLLIGTQDGFLIYESLSSLSESTSPSYSVPIGVASISAVSDTDFALGLSGNGSIIFFDLLKRNFTGTVKTPLTSVKCLQTDGRYLFAGGKGSADIYRIEMATKSILDVWKTSGTETTSMSIDHRKNWIVAITSGQQYKTHLNICCIHAFPIADMSVEASTPLTGVSFTTDSRMVLSCFGPLQLEAKLDGVISTLPGVDFSGAGGVVVSSGFILFFGLCAVVLLSPTDHTVKLKLGI